MCYASMSDDPIAKAIDRSAISHGRTLIELDILREYVDDLARAGFGEPAESVIERGFAKLRNEKSK